MVQIFYEIIVAQKEVLNESVKIALCLKPAADVLSEREMRMRSSSLPLNLCPKVVDLGNRAGRVPAPRPLSDDIPNGAHASARAVYVYMCRFVSHFSVRIIYHDYSLMRRRATNDCLLAGQRFGGRAFVFSVRSAVGAAITTSARTGNGSDTIYY
ncbi:hypothetical protein EVAR_91436_1 [Eumeta japonica]|uniref:Uncharacterized protein n=1 Tax=Eumeta variegata TaxID=151549 RepID=A0A4C1X366_EUMVA|nr:hypothetical protein EVAR_91436_1 [Eumeta japonica]